MKKRILALLLAACIAVSMLVLPASAANNNTAVQFAVTLGAMDNTQTGALNAAVTRGAFARMLVAFSTFRESVGAVQCEYFALEGISKLLNTIKIIKSKLNPKLEIEGFLLTMYDSRLRLANQIYDEVKRHFQELVFKTVIQRNVKLSESPSHGLPVILYDAESNGAKNHLALAKEIINKNR